MDTLKERAALEDMHRTGHRPWALWERSPSTQFVPRVPVPTFTRPSDSSHVA